VEEFSKEIFGMNFPHKKHLIEQKIECSSCHSNVRTHGEFIATKKSCASCHHKGTNTDLDCGSCHKLQRTFYLGGEMNGEEIPKDIMAEAEVECLDCHLGDNERIYRSDKRKCAECHDEDYAEMHTEWQSSISELISSLTNAINAKKKLKLSLQEKEDLRRIENKLQKIRLDGSIGIHNYMFIEETLAGLKKQIESLDNSN
jgi:RecJ-like exonuclease